MIRQTLSKVSTAGGNWLGRLSLILLLAYPVALHLGVVSDSLQPALILLLALMLLSGLLMLARGNRYGWAVLGGFMAAAGWVTLYHGEPETLLKLPPVLINGILCLLFGYTLLPGRKPLISRFAEIMHGHALDALSLRYTRGVTLLWSALFALLMLESLLLGLFAEPEVWSLFTNFLNYLFVLLLFVVEYRLRLRRLPHLEHAGFFRFLLDLRRIDWRRLQ
ncbi:MAG: hypothetical protein P8103_20275 [Candidatus Thiodiazotropha sp.]